MTAKTPTTIYDSTLVEHWQALVTLQQIDWLCDSNGFAYATSFGIHKGSGIPLEVIDKGVCILEDEGYIYLDKDGWIYRIQAGEEEG